MPIRTFGGGVQSALAGQRAEQRAQQELEAQIARQEALTRQGDLTLGQGERRLGLEEQLHQAILALRQAQADKASAETGEITQRSSALEELQKSLQPPQAQTLPQGAEPGRIALRGVDDTTPPDAGRRMLSNMIGLSPSGIFGQAQMPFDTEQARADANQRREFSTKAEVGDVPVTTRQLFDPEIGRNVTQTVPTHQLARGGDTSLAPLSAETSKDIATSDAALSGLNRIADLAERVMQKGLIGPAAGRVAGVRQGLPDVFGGQVDQDFAALNTEIEIVKDSLIRARSGAQINEEELRRLDAQLPSLTKRPERFFIDLLATQRNIQDLQRAKALGVPFSSVRGSEGGGAQIISIEEVP